MFDLGKIWQFFRKNFSRRDVLFIALIILLFFALRVYNLLSLPIFTDEAIYIHWSRLAWKDASWRFVSLTDGKQPLHTWGMIPFLKIFADPLFAGRLFSVFTGLFTLAGVFVLLFYLWGKKAAYIGSLIYILTPYYIFFDRMALIDSAVNGFAVWTLLFSLILIKHIRLDMAILFGLLAGVGSLAKSTVRLFFLPVALAPFIFYFRDKKKVTKALNFYFLLGVAVALVLVIYNVQRLSPYMHYVEQKNTTFVMTLPELMRSPLEVLPHNLRAIPYYLFQNTGWLFMVFAIGGLYKLWRKDPELALYLVVWFVVPFLVIAIFAKVLSSRYVIFLALPFLLGLTYFLITLKRKGFYLASLLLLLSVSYFLYTIFFNTGKIPLPPVDRGQYIEDWPSGYGTREIVDFLERESKKDKVYVFTEGTFGLLPYALDIYLLFENPNVHFEDRWPLKIEDFAYARELGQTNPVYFVFHEREEYPPDWPLELIKKYPRYGNQSFVYLFKLAR